MTFCFVAYLNVVEETNIKKYELVLNLNQQMNEIENSEFYYVPLCKYFLKNLPDSKEVNNSLKKIINAKSSEVRKEECDKLSYYLRENLVERKYKKTYFSNSINPFFVIKEILFVGKEGWKASAKDNNRDAKKSSPFGDTFSLIVQSAYLDKNKSSKVKEDKDALKGELVTEKSLEILSSAYGSDTALKVASDLSEIQSKKVNVVLLYITVPEFDKIMHNTSSYELFSKLRKQIASISKIVIDNGGDIDKIMGEKLLIAFGVKDKTPEEVARFTGC